MKKYLLPVLFAGLLFFSGCGAVDKLERDMKSSDPEVRREAAKKLGEMGSNEALTVLTVYQDDKDFRVKEVINASIKKINAQTFMK